MKVDELTIRQFQDNDRQQVAELWRRCFGYEQPWNLPDEVIRRKVAQRDGLFWIALLGEQIVGTAAAGYDGIRGWLYSVAVLPEFRRQGIAEKLVRHAVEELARRGCPKANLQVHSHNHGAVSLYEKLGFVREDRIQMAKLLQPTTAAAPSCICVPTIEIAEGVFLSPVALDDKDALLEYLNETPEFHQGTLRIPYPYTSADADQWLQELYLHRADCDRTRVWAVRRDGRMIGSCGLSDIQSGNQAEIGYWIARPFWKQGIGTTVVRAICSYAFSEFSLHKIRAQVFPENAASVRLLENLGFVQEGLLRQHVNYFGKFRDVYLYGLLADELK